MELKNKKNVSWLGSKSSIIGQLVQKATVGSLIHEEPVRVLPLQKHTTMELRFSERRETKPGFPHRFGR